MLQGLRRQDQVETRVGVCQVGQILIAATIDDGPRLGAWREVGRGEMRQGPEHLVQAVDPVDLRHPERPRLGMPDPFGQPTARASAAGRRETSRGRRRPAAVPGACRRTRRNRTTRAGPSPPPDGATGPRVLPAGAGSRGDDDRARVPSTATDGASPVPSATDGVEMLPQPPREPVAAVPGWEQSPFQPGRKRVASHRLEPVRLSRGDRATLTLFTPRATISCKTSNRVGNCVKT